MIVVKSDGSSITPANISFSNATVTYVVVDAGTTGIAADAFKYENGALTMTAFDSVTSTTCQKVTATFSLAPSDSRDTLNNPTETVEIEVVKGTKFEATDKLGNSQTLGKTLAMPININITSGKLLFIGALDTLTTIDDNGGKITVKNNTTQSPTDDDIGSVKEVSDIFKKQLNEYADLKKYFGESGVSGLTYVSGKNEKVVTFTFKLTPLPEYEFAVTDWTLVLDTTDKGGKFGD